MIIDVHAHYDDEAFEEDLDECKKMNAMCIFEHFIPKK